VYSWAAPDPAERQFRAPLDHLLRVGTPAGANDYYSEMLQVRCRTHSGLLSAPYVAESESRAGFPLTG